jgi:hypothetical protein
VHSGGKSGLPVGYMRIEFETVLITGVDWSDGDLVKEKIEFICRKMSIKLRKQADSGDVVEAGQTTATWERKQDPTGGRADGRRRRNRPDDDVRHRRVQPAAGRGRAPVSKSLNKDNVFTKGFKKGSSSRSTISR